MLAAISTTILSRRSCALTGSAITSRSRRNSTRGPPSAPRIIEVLMAAASLRPDHVRIATVDQGSAAAFASGYSQWAMQGASQSAVRFTVGRVRPKAGPAITHKAAQNADPAPDHPKRDQDGELAGRAVHLVNAAPGRGAGKGEPRKDDRVQRKSRRPDRP